MLFESPGSPGTSKNGTEKPEKNENSGCEKKPEKIGFRDLPGARAAACAGPAGGRGDGRIY